MGDDLQYAAAPDATTIGKDILGPVVCQAYGDLHATIQDWKCDLLNGGIGGGAIFRFSGQGQISGTNRGWSIILKVLTRIARDSSNEPAAWNYFKREADFYRSGWLDNSSGAIGAPRLYHVVDFSDDTCWLWLEDVQGAKGQWTMQDYEQVARSIGQFNGAFLSERTQSNPVWMSSGWIKSYSNSSAEGMKILSNSLDHPLVKRWYPGNSSEKLFQLWHQRERYFRVMDQLPQTFCHFDLFRRNMFLLETDSGHSRTVAVDWAFAGSGCIGADISPLVIASLAFFEAPLDKTRELDEIIFNGYISGLQQSGWQGDSRLARLGFLIANLRYSFSEIGGWMSGVFDENVRNVIEQAFGHPLGEVFDYLAMLMSVTSYIHDERDELMTELNLG